MALPPSFSGRPPSIARLPQPINAAAPIADGINALADATTRAQRSREASEERVAEIDLQVRRIERDRELGRMTADRAVALAEAQGQLQVDLINLRAEAGPGAAGHEQRVEERIAKFRDDFMASLGGDQELTDRFADNVANMAASARVAETQFAVRSRAEKNANDFAILSETMANQIGTRAAAGEATGQDLANARSLWASAVDAAPLPANAKEELLRNGNRLFTFRAAEGAIQVNPQAVLDQIAAGAFDADLNGDEKATLRNRAQALVDKAAREAESQANEAVKVQRANARVLIEQVGEGVAVDGQQLQAALAIASASQDPEDINLAHDLDVALARNETTVQFDNAGNDERLAAQREIEASKDWQKNQRLVAAHDQLGTLIERDKREASADPLGLYVRQTGQPTAPANLADRASMAARFAIGDRVAQRDPDTPPTHLFEEEAAQLRDQWNRGTPADRAQLVLQVGSYGPRRGRELMRQIAPTKPQHARLVELASFRDPALKGLVREALDGWAQPPSKVVNSAAMAADANGGEIGPALAGIPAERRSAIMQVATGIYAYRAAQGSVTAFDRDLWRESLSAALGGASGRGGFGRTAEGDTFVLPASMTQPQFDGIMVTATGRELVAAAGNQAALWGNGKPLTVGDPRRLTPVLVRDDGQVARYAFRARNGGLVRRADGADFLLDMRQLARTIERRAGQ